MVVNVEPDADPFVFFLLPLLRLLSAPSNINSASIRLLRCITFLSFCSRENRATLSVPDTLPTDSGLLVAILLHYFGRAMIQGSPM